MRTKTFTPEQFFAAYDRVIALDEGSALSIGYPTFITTMLIYYRGQLLGAGIPSLNAHCYRHWDDLFPQFKPLSRHQINYRLTKVYNKFVEVAENHEQSEMLCRIFGKREIDPDFPQL